MNSLLWRSLAIVVVIGSIVAWWKFDARTAAPGQTASLTTVIEDLPPQAQALVRNVAARSLAQTPPPGRSANDLGWDCLAAASLARLGNPAALPRLRLLVKAIRDIGQPFGQGLAWSADPPADQEAACGVGSWRGMNPPGCLPPHSAFAFQSGLAGTCLAESALILGDSELGDLARRSFHAWDSERTLDIPGCKDCIYYWWTTAPNERGRYVRNMNLFMGLDAASVAALGDADGARVARGVYMADIWERRSGNFGYHGRLDPTWQARASEATRIENHSAGDALISRLVGSKLDWPEASEHGLNVWRDWAECRDSRCSTGGCRYWGGDPAVCLETATFVHCAFRRVDATAKARCEMALGRATNITSMALLSVLSGGAP